MRFTPLQLLLLSLILGIVGAVGMPPVCFVPALAVSLSGYWLVLPSFEKKRHAALSGFLYGLGYFTAGLWWIGNALLVDGNPYAWVYPLAVVGLPALLSIFPAVSSFLIFRFFGGRSLTSWIAFCTITGLTEWVRGHAFTGFPWNLYGMTWTTLLPMLQSLSSIGIYGLGLITIFMLSAPGFAIAETTPRRAKRAVLFFAGLSCTLLWTWGNNRLDENPTRYNEDVAIRIVQPNIPQGEKWDNDLFWTNFERTLGAFSDMKESPLPAKLRVLILPETALHFGLFEIPEAMDRIAGAMTGAQADYLLSGALLRSLTQDGARQYHNSLIALDQQAQIVATFDKFHLVPFGEYMPLENLIPIGPIVGFSGFIHGPGPKTFSLNPEGNTPLPPYSPLVCYEIIFPGKVTNPDKPDWIVNVTNDGWYAISPGPHQHLGHAVYRAIEEGLPVVRSANTGISAIIDPVGRKTLEIPLSQTGAREQYLPRPVAENTFYSKWKDSIFFFLVTLILLEITYIRSHKFRRP